MNNQHRLYGIWRRTKAFVWFLAVSLLLYLGVSWYMLQETVTPSRVQNTITPDQLGFHETESIELNSLDDGVRLQGWLVPSAGQRAVVLLHGVHSHAWDGSLVDLARAYTRAGVDAMLLDLRGHGKSAGRHVGLGLRERGDVRAAINELLMRGFEAGKIGIHGLSYGAAVAVMAVAESKEIGAVIADSAFADARDVIAGEISRETGFSTSVAEFLLPGVSFLSQRLHSMELSKSAPEQVIAGISPRPVLLIHGTEDSVIPFDHTRRLQAAGDSNVELWPLVGYKHTEGIRLEPGYPKWSPMREPYLRRVTQFLLDAL